MDCPARGREEDSPLVIIEPGHAPRDHVARDDRSAHVGARSVVVNEPATSAGPSPCSPSATDTSAPRRGCRRGPLQGGWQTDAQELRRPPHRACPRAAPGDCRRSPSQGRAAWGSSASGQSRAALAQQPPAIRDPDPRPPWTRNASPRPLASRARRRWGEYSVRGGHRQDPGSRAQWSPPEGKVRAVQTSEVRPCERSDRAGDRPSVPRTD